MMTYRGTPPGKKSMKKSVITFEDQSQMPVMSKATYLRKKSRQSWKWFKGPVIETKRRRR